MKHLCGAVRACRRRRPGPLPATHSFYCKHNTPSTGYRSAHSPPLLHGHLWTWNYLREKNIALGYFVDFPDSADIYHAIHLSFDIWVTEPLRFPDDIKAFRNSFNKAKAQRKYKKKQEDKVNVQFFLDVKTRAQLKELSRVRRLSAGEMLHDLIVKEYKRYKHSK